MVEDAEKALELDDGPAVRGIGQGGTGKEGVEGVAEKPGRLI